MLTFIFMLASVLVFTVLLSLTVVILGSILEKQDKLADEKLIDSMLDRLTNGKIK